MKLTRALRQLIVRTRASLNRRLRTYADDPARYWELRHQREGESLDGVGQIGLGHDKNEEDYAEKWLHISAALDGARVDPQARVLDAGCGIGWVSQRLSERGHDLVLVDFSREAIGIAVRRLETTPEAHVQSLDTPVPGHPFAAVVCIDVLFHIVDDPAWQRTVENLAAMTANEGFLVIQENLVATGEQTSSAEHVRWRTIDDYSWVLDGWRLQVLDSYRLPHANTTKDLMVWQRAEPA